MFVNVSDEDRSPTLMAGVPSSKGVNGYGLLLVSDDDARLSKWVDGARSDLDRLSPSFGESDNLELVIKPPASGNDTVEGAVWQVDSSFNRTQQVLTTSVTDSDFAGNRGVGMMAQSGSDTGRVGDQLTRGRGID